METKLKTAIGAGLAFAALTFMTASYAQAALTNPVLDFQGTIQVNLDANDNIVAMGGGVFVTQYVDTNNSIHSLFSQDPDPILGQAVSGSMFSGIHYDWDSDILTIEPDASGQFEILDPTSGDYYLTATATNYEVVQTGDRSYQVSAVLSDHTYFHTGDSLFMEQYSSVVGDGHALLYTWEMIWSAGTGDWDYNVNISGKIGPDDSSTPNAVPIPGALMLLASGLFPLGLWRTRR